MIEAVSLGLFKKGNYWRKNDAQKVSFLVDAANYYSALASAMEQAQHSILIVGWNISARAPIRLHPEPQFLNAFLHNLVNQRPDLEVYLLGWNFPVALFPGRDLPPALNPAWKEHPRIHHKIDDFHPIGACHHQKIVVVDDDIAFAGGLDICEERWDTPEHKAADPRRQDSDHDPYPPFHDVQMMVQGPVAKDLGDLIRNRWKLSFDIEALANPKIKSLKWPESLPIHIQNAEVAVSVTYPYFGGQSEQREVENLLLELLERAQKTVYIENQYLAATRIGAALQELLRKETGPEVIVVLPERPANLLEGSAMTVLQNRLIKKLKRADRFNRLGVFYPSIPNLGIERLTVHSKLMIVDDQYVTVGSANLNNRSMGLDTECNLSLEASDRPDIQKAISDFRTQLLCEHLGLKEDEFYELLKSQPSLLQLIQSRTHFPRSLKLLKAQGSSLFRFVTWGRIFDPSTTMAREQLLSDFLKDDTKRFPQHTPWAYPLFLILLFLTLASLWLWKSPPNWESRNHSSLEVFFYSLLLFGVGSSLLIPPTLLLMSSILLWGPGKVFFFAWMGLVVASLIQYTIGSFIPQDRLRHLLRKSRIVFFQQVGKLKRFPNFVLRLIAMAPLTSLNLVSGASRSLLGRFVLFTIFASLPILSGFSLIEFILEKCSQKFGSESVALIFVMLALLISGFLFRPQGKRRSSQ